jgi:hypothetical protein
VIVRQRRIIDLFLIRLRSCKKGVGTLDVLGNGFGFTEKLV